MEVSQLVRTILMKRGIEHEDEIAAFLNPDYDLHTHDPFLLQGMDRAVERLFEAFDRNERIAIYADFDCDGIPGAALLSDFFTKIGYENFEVYLPHRDREGYGFHTEAITTFAEREVKLIITVDVGTNAVDAVRFAKDKGADVIVTDHHEPMREPSVSHGSGVTTLPKAVAVLNPKLGDYLFRDLCGAAVAFKLVQAALREGKRRALPAFAAIPDGWEKWLLDMVALATVADMVPLIGENRVLVHFGLKVLRRSQRRGVDALCNRLRLRKSELTEDDIGFSLAPRVNAASRMDEPDLAFRLLTTKDPREAEGLASQLEKLNASRKGVVASVVRHARAHARERFREGDKVVVLGDPSWKPALLGLAANSLMQERGGVVCLWGRDGAGRLKGSCRSDGGVSLVELFASAGDIFEECGGHHASGGFTVSHERVHHLADALVSATQKLAAAPRKVEERTHDFIITLPEISSSLYREVSLLSPYGAGNPKPVFLVSDALVTAVRRFGKEKAHIELELECRKSGARCRAFEFFKAPEDFSLAPVQGAEARLLATLERDTFRGGFALRAVDFVAAE